MSPNPRQMKSQKDEGEEYDFFSTIRQWNVKVTRKNCPFLYKILSLDNDEQIKYIIRLSEKAYNSLEKEILQIKYQIKQKINFNKYILQE